MQNILFQPLRVGPREIPNRIIFGSHTTNYAQHNLLSERHADYYAARAAGGAGTIVLEEHIVHPSDIPYQNALAGYLPGTTSAIARVTERIHTHSALVLVQLNHNGQQSTSDYRQRELWAPSAVPGVASREVPKAMELADISAVIAGFAAVAQIVRQADADGVELNISDSSLLRQFLSPLTNLRSDQYGGSLANRLRFVQETLEAVSSALGPERILGVRLCADELAPWAGLTPEQGVEIARILVGTGRVDYMTITMGSIFSTHMFPFHASMHTPPAYAAHLAAGIKAATNIPVFAAGRIMSASQAERILSEGQADGVEMIRALIADPQLPHLSRAGQADEARPCISCNQGCQVRSVMNVPLSCTVNPDVLTAQIPSLLLEGQSPITRRGGGGWDERMGRLRRPGEVGLVPQPAAGATQAPHPHLSTTSVPTSENDLPILIIGGGPAGMEAARTAALRGRRVLLYEREAALGGTVTLAAKGPGRGELQRITDYLLAQLSKLHVAIHLGSELTPELVLEQQASAVVVATGAQPAPGLLPIPGHELSHVTNIRRILSGDQIAGHKVVILDETASHGVLSVAELLASRGYAVEIVTEDWYVGRDLVATHDLVPWMQRVLALGLTMTPHTTITRIEPGQVIVSDRFVASEYAIPADVVVLGTYERPSQELYYALKGRVPRLFRAGDCVAPRRIEQAILEGRQIGEQC